LSTGVKELQTAIFTSNFQEVKQHKTKPKNPKFILSNQSAANALLTS
jgi:hypothetical protein